MKPNGGSSDDGDNDSAGQSQLQGGEVDERTYEKAENLETIKYIKETFKKRECISFVPDPKQSDLCQCGYMNDKHRQDINVFKKKSTWDVETSTDTSETDAFGVVEFSAYGQKTSKFIRVDYKTDVEKLWELMHDKWQMDMPRLLISVTGGAQKLVMKPALKEVFRKGLVEAAQSTGAWIITGGTNTGVMKQVGEAIRAHALKQGSRKQLVAIGVATWGCIENPDALIEKPEALYEFADPTEGEKEEKKESPLDPNHTHFILADNGTRNQYGAEIALRAALENKISNMKACGVKIPIVCVVIEGGTNTVETAKQAISANTPVIIVEGSGRAADVLAYAYNRYKPPPEDPQKLQTVETENKVLWQQLEEQIVNELKSKKPDEVLNNIKFCLENRNMITVHKLDDKGSAKNIDVAIIMTLLKVKQNETSTFDQLSLALAWDRIDVVKEHIYTDEVKLTPKELEELAFNAIINNRVEFVKFFLEKRLSLGDLLANHSIAVFYKAMKTSQHLKDIFKDADTRNKLDNFIFKLVDRLFDPSTSRVLQRQKSLGAEGSIMLVPWTKSAAANDDAAMDLFFWAILNRMKSMAVVFMYEAKEKFALALVGHLMLKNLLKREKDSESAQKLQKQVDFYEGLTTGLLAECYSSNQEMTIDLLVRPTFARRTLNSNSCTALEIAVQADNQSFIAHQACQTLLEQIWMGKISDDNPSYKMLLSVPSFLFAPLLLKFREEPSTVQGETTMDGAADEKGLENQTKRKPSSPAATADEPDDQSAQTKKNPCCVYFRRLGYFVNAPFVKFSFNCVSYVVLLLLYSIILLTNFYPTISIAEYVLIFWVITIVCEEIRQIVTSREGGSRKLYNYFSDKWNIVDVIAVCTFAIGLALRVVPLSVCERCFFAARIVLAINLMTFYFRILHMFSIHRELGPKLVMIGKMMIDLLYFMTILLVFIVAYGIAAHVILYPNQELRLSLVRDVLSGAWWSVYGEFHIDEVSGENCKAAAGQRLSVEDCASMDYGDFNRTLCPGKKEECPAIDWFVPILLAIYALITNVMMINLLIAMFSNTFSKVEEIADVVWKIQRYHLVLEYESHPVFPPPLIVIEHLCLLVEMLLRKLRSCCQKNNATSADRKQQTSTKHKTISRKRTFKMRFGEHYERDLMAWLNAIVEEYLLKKESEDAAADRLAKETNERIDDVLRKVEEIADTRNLDKRLKSLEEQMSQIIEMLSRKR